MLIARRRTYMRYLRKKEFELYREVVAYLGIRDIGFPDVGQHQNIKYRPTDRKYDPLENKNMKPSEHPPKIGKKKRKKRTKKMWRRNR